MSQDLLVGNHRFNFLKISISLTYILETLLGLDVPLVRSAMDHSFLAAHSVGSEGTLSLRWGIDRHFKSVMCKQNDWLSQFMSLNLIGD